MGKTFLKLHYVVDVNDADIQIEKNNNRRTISIPIDRDLNLNVNVNVDIDPNVLLFCKFVFLFYLFSSMIMGSYMIVLFIRASCHIFGYFSSLWL